MSAILISGVVFICVVGAALLGLVLHVKLPDHHLDGDSKDVVKLVMGLIATMAALVLSLLIASANSSYNTQRTEVEQLAADIVLLDRILAHYGPDTTDARDLLRRNVVAVLKQIWPNDGVGSATLEPPQARGEAEDIYDRIQSLSPKTDAQRFGQSRALQLLTGLKEMRLLMHEQAGGSISWPFLVVLVFWLAVLFAGFGLFARFNATVLAALLVGALSVAGAIFLVLEMNQPYSGLMQISSAPIRNALAQIGR